MEQLCMDIKALQAMHRFGDTLESAIKSINSDIAEFVPIRDARDCIGRHWYGLRCQVTDKRNGAGYYLHIGLIYYPATRAGLMVELDEQNNQSCYACVLESIKERPAFEINRAEPEYFKLFMKNDRFEHMSKLKRGEQLTALKKFVQDAGEAIVEAAYETGFSITYKNLADALNLADAFEKAINEVKGSGSKVTVNYQDKDNFGQYAQGFRYYLTDQEETVSLYAYFGAIYSYKKSPAGIFAEVDWFSNQDSFDNVFANIEPSKSYLLSKKEPKFVKLFLPEKDTAEFNRSDYKTQIEMLKGFLKTCNDNIINAAKSGGTNHGR